MRRRGRDIEYEVELTLREAYAGTTRQISLTGPNGSRKRLEVTIPALESGNNSLDIRLIDLITGDEKTLGSTIITGSQYSPQSSLHDPTQALNMNIMPSRARILSHALYNS